MDEKTRNKYSKIFSIIIISTITFFIFLTFFLEALIYGEKYYLTPKSPDGVQLYTRTEGFIGSSRSRVYIKYSIFDNVDTGVEFWDDKGPGLCGNNSDYFVNWIDDSHVTISFRSCGHAGYRTVKITY